jgi:tRNA nucleotidyltransferase (CCA-adding enzyme)
MDQMSDEDLRVALKRLGFLSREIQKWAAQKQAADRILPRMPSLSRMAPSQVFAILHGFAGEALLYLVAKTRDRGAKRQLSQFISRYRGVRPVLTGEDLKAMGLEPGPVFRKTLDALRDARLDGKIASREDEVAFVRERVLPATV